MNEFSEKASPLISFSGNVYSLSGIKRLINALNFNKKVKNPHLFNEQKVTKQQPTDVSRYPLKCVDDQLRG